MEGYVVNPEMRIIWRLAARALAGGIVAAGIAWHYVGKQPDEYRATALLLLNAATHERPELAAPTSAAMHFEKPDPARFLKDGKPHPMAMPDYAALLLSDEVMERLRPVMTELLAAHDPEAPPPSRSRVRAALEAKPRVLLQTPYDIYYQHTLELKATTAHPELSAGLANAWVEVGLGLISEMETRRGRGGAGAVSNNEAIFSIASRAYPPEGPSGPNRRLTLLTALLAGLLLGPAHFFFMRALRQYAPLLSRHDPL